ncbi:MAG: tRNA (cytidine(56)-2'-O)-methyltransferase [Candidatus Micrarchaeia archaeon]
MHVSVLRLGHRIKRDERATTHVCLVARAFGASEVFISGDKDTALIERIGKMQEKWGFGITVKHVKNWREVLDNWHGIKVHLTMYGLPVSHVLSEIKKAENILVIVGSQKVPPEIYKNADFNVSITNQPHSEIAALAVFLDHLFEGAELEQNSFKNAKHRIIPSARSKLIRRYL